MAQAGLDVGFTGVTQRTTQVSRGRDVDIGDWKLDDCHTVVGLLT